MNTTDTPGLFARMTHLLGSHDGGAGTDHGGTVMKASDVMTTTVISVPPHAVARTIAKTLIDHRISAVPVVDDSGAPIGMVSEGDLMPRDETDRNARRDWWLLMLSEGETIGTEFVSFLEKDQRTAREIMSAPLVTVPDTADLVEVAGLLATHHIKRVPVLAAGKMVGIVSRADLIRAVANHGKAAEPTPSVARGPVNFEAAAEHLEALQAKQAKAKAAAGASAGSPAAPVPELSAKSFRGLVERHESDEDAVRNEAHRQAAEKRHHEVDALLAADLTDAAWERMIHEAQVAAEKGEPEHELMRFPCELCTDHGRAVNVPDPSWPATLRGVPAQVFMRWKEELQPKGFVLQARIVDFPDGKPGDVGLYLAWGK